MSNVFWRYLSLIIILVVLFILMMLGELELLVKIGLVCIIANSLGILVFALLPSTIIRGKAILYGFFYNLLLFFFISQMSSPINQNFGLWMLGIVGSMVMLVSLLFWDISKKSSE